MHIFVTNLSTGISSYDTERLFYRFGEVEAATVWVHRENRSIRFAIVDMGDDDEGARAIKKLHRKNFSGRQLWVEEAPGALVHMLSLCVEAPQILRTHDAWLHDDGDD